MSTLRFPSRQVVLACAVVAFSVLCYRTAWLSDDAVISLRTVHNWLHGYGLRWNVDERVQTYTHPLWLLLLTAAHACTGEPFFSTLYFSWFVSTAAAALLLFAWRGAVFDKLLALTVLAFSQAFVDFSSSGLENPLTHLLVVSFVALYADDQLTPQRRNFWLAMTAGLAAWNRMDSALLFAPALGHVAWRDRHQVPLRYYLAGALPLLGWEIFAVIYYGFPFPNTAYAKLAQDRGDTLVRWYKGYNYLKNSWINDPITLAATFGSALWCAVRRDSARAWLLGGAFAYVLYTVNVGGDFMSGRFLSAPLCMSMACLVSGQWLKTAPARVGALAFVAVLAWSGRYAAPFLDSDYKMAPGEPETDTIGIHNERRMFFDISSLLHADEMNPLRPEHRWARGGRLLKALAEHDPVQRVQVVDAIGYAGYFAGPGVHIVDQWALADALIARLPPVTGQYGHYPRVIPAGYVDTLRERRNHIVDPALATYYDELEHVIRGPIWSTERLQAIWRLNTGQLQDKLDQYAYVRSRQLQVRVPLRNPGAYAFVVAYVWNEGNTSGYHLDLHSERGKTYELEWLIDARGAVLTSPPGIPQTIALPGLQPSGVFSVSVGFAEQPGKPAQEVHELRYRYRLRGDMIELQRQPLPMWNENFPEGPWIDGRHPGVFGPEQTSAVP